jgi:hypothetical protein
MKKNKNSRSPIKSIKTTSSKSKGRASEKEIIQLIINNRTNAIFNAILNGMDKQFNHDSFDPNQLEFIEVSPKKHYGAPIKHENPLKSSPPSFYRTICLQFDILKTADKMKIMKVINFPQIVQLIEIYGSAAKCLSLRTLVTRVLLAQSKNNLEYFFY